MVCINDASERSAFIEDVSKAPLRIPCLSFVKTAFMSDSSHRTPCTRGCSSTLNASCNEVYDASTCAFGFGGGGGTESVGSLLRKDAANAECSIIQWYSAEMRVLLNVRSLSSNALRKPTSLCHRTRDRS